MWYLAPLVIIIVGLWVGRKYLRSWIISLQNKRNKKQKIKPIDQDFIFEPIKSSRTFVIAIKIEELGGGKAKMSVEKIDLQ